MSTGTFASQPPGVEGLKALAAVDPLLEANFLILLEGLPTSQLGVWVIGGMSSVFKDQTNRDRFQQLLGKWASVSDNKMLQAAASSALSVTKTGR
jgi:hypothetical protein